jgi:signal transduction histidine kinase
MAVQGYCGLLLAGQMGRVNPEQVRILERMQRSLARLGDLASAMTEFGGGTNVSARLDVKSANLDACVNQAIHEVGPLAAQKQISVNVELEPPAGSLMFDPGQLEQVLVNLLDNGCKFTPRRGTIEVRGYSVSGDELRNSAPPDFCSGYRIDVSDTGPGIPAPHIEHIFDEYTSYSGPSDRSGAGLGLAICRMIINAHNGRIWANPEGQGAKFSLVLPYVRMHIVEEACEPAMRAAV